MSERNIAIEYIRGVAMLGVIGIHTGAYSLANPNVNIHLFALLEICSRFSVPIFFFVSSFGLFFHQKPTEPLDYRQYFSRRCRAVLIPYLSWSGLYMLHQSLITDDFWQWTPPNLFQSLLFGLASYHLYFLVILLWFYVLMPVWRAILPPILENPLRNLAVILVAQIVFNYYSSYYLQATSDNIIIRLAIQYRMSYLVLHYLFIFLFGAVCALRYKDFLAFIEHNRQAIKLFFAVTLAGMLVSYYWLLTVKGYAPQEAVDTVHQLSPVGVLYTLASTLFCMMVFIRHQPSSITQAMLASLARYSYPIYLVHPLVMFYLVAWLSSLGLTMTTPVTIAFYFTTVLFSLGFGITMRKASASLPLLGLLLTGTYPAPKKS